MMNGKWRGTILFLAIFAVMGATLGLRFYSEAPTSLFSTSLTPTSGTSPTTAATAPAATSSSPAATSAAKPATPQATSATGTAVKSITGDPQGTPYGDVQVKVSFKGKKITNVTVLQIPNSGNYDQSVAQAAPPILLQEIISSQSANVNTVSGGTYTSIGYLQSVQSAIDKLG
jgi:uncharacterized protein with FMN-binding domain